MILCFVLICVISIVGTQVYLHRLLQKRQFDQEGHDIGAVLAKKVHKQQTRFLITHKGYSHYYLESEATGEKLLVAKTKVHEDFDVA